MRADGEEAREDLRHAEVAQAPGERGDDGDEAVGDGLAEDGHTVLNNLHAVGANDRRGGHRGGDEAGDIREERRGVLNAASSGDGADEHHDEHEEHEAALHEVGGNHGEVAAHHRVQEDDEGAQSHHGGVVHTEQRVKELPHGHEAAAHVDAEEEHRDEGRDGADDVLVVFEAAVVEARHGDGVGCLGVLAQALGDELPVEPGADGQADGSPAGLREAGEVRQARQAHEQVAAHVRRLCRQGREPGTDLATAQEVFGCGRVGPLRVHKTDGEHDDEVEDHRQKYEEISGFHKLPFG